MFHKLTIVGHVGRTAEMRVTPNGKEVTSFSVACQDGFGDNKKTIWYNVEAWGKTAEICNQYVQKGMLVLVDGRLKPDATTGNPRIWNDNSGTARSSFEVVANEVRFLSKVEQSAVTSDEEPF